MFKLHCPFCDEHRDEEEFTGVLDQVARIPGFKVSAVSISVC